MNGIYNFDGYSTPYLDVEMLMERKAQKRKRRLMVLTGIATVLMATMAVIMLYLISTVSKTACMILSIVLGVYIIAALIMIGRFVRKGEYLWQHQEQL